MAYSTFENSGDDLQRKLKEVERTWHFGRAYVCHKGGFQHQHVSENDFRRCNGGLEEQRRKAKQDEREKERQDRREQCEREDMKTKRDQVHEKYLKDKDLEIATEKTKEVETRAKAERDLRDLEEQRRKAKQDERDKELQDRREQCEREAMKTKQKEEHEKYLKEKDLQVAAEKTKLEQIRASFERDLVEKRRQAKQNDKDKILRIKELELQASREQCERDEEHEKNLKYLKDKDLEIATEKRKTEEIRSKAERDMVEPRRQAMQMKHDHEIKLKKLEMEQQAKSAELEERKIKVEENKANNMKDLLAFLKPKRPRSYHGAIDRRLCEMSPLHLDIDPSTSSIKITSDNDAVPSAINRIVT